MRRFWCSICFSPILFYFGSISAFAQPSPAPLHWPLAVDLYDSTNIAAQSQRLDSLLDQLWANQPQQQGLRLKEGLDSLFTTSSLRPFNGSVLISQSGKPIYERVFGHADVLKKTAWPRHPQFVIGSVSKQITAVLVLRACDQGLLDLHVPIHKYLPQLSQPWADTVTVHHLLNHTSGLRTKTQPLTFHPGSQFSYSNDGYALLGEIVAAVNVKSYEDLVQALFKRCKMRHSNTPSDRGPKNMLEGFSRQMDGSIAMDKTTFENTLVSAGGLISNPQDIARWNEMLHSRRKLLSPETYKSMTTASSMRNHPIFGNVDYGYGLQFTHDDGIAEISHGGYAPGFVTVNFYYPETQISLVIMENLDWKDPAFKQSFSYEMEARKRLRASELLDGPSESAQIGK